MKLNRVRKVALIISGACSLALASFACRHNDGEVRPPSTVDSEGTSSSTAASGSSNVNAEAVPAPPANAVQREMQLLVAALQGTISAIADDDLARVPALIHGAHVAKEATEAALADGSYQLPKNAEQIETFKALDEAFHADLIGLVKAARADDLAATTTQLGKLLNQCKACHVLFRELPPRPQASSPHSPGAAAASNGKGVTQ